MKVLLVEDLDKEIQINRREKEEHRDHKGKLWIVIDFFSSMILFVG